MKSFKLKYRAVSILIMMAIMPSILGVHVFQHHCNGCEEDETITRIITTAHDHHHACDNCSCANACDSCHDLTGKHVHHQEQDETCQHQFKKASIEGQTAQLKYKIEAPSVDLFLPPTLVVDWAYDIILVSQLQLNVLQKIPDEPSPELNGVFRL